MMFRVVGLVALLASEPEPLQPGALDPALLDPGPRLELRLRTLAVPAEAVSGGATSGSPVFQWLELSGYGLSTPGLSVHASVWGFVGLGSGGDRITSDRLSGDVDVLYVEYAHPEGRFGARAGRQLVFAGPGIGYFGQIDGGYARAQLAELGVEVFGGRVVRPRFDGLGEYDWAAGARAGYHRWSLINAGLSYLHARTRGDLARHVAGADLAIVLGDRFDIGAAAGYDLVDPGVLQARVVTRFEPLDRLTVGLSLEQGSPGRLLDKTSIFSVFALGDYVLAQAFAQLALTRQWVVGGRYGRTFFPGSSGNGFGEQANQAGASVTAYVTPNLWLTLEVERLAAADNGYTSIRTAAQLMVLENVSLAADLLGYFYDERPLAHGEAALRSVAARLFGDLMVAKAFQIGAGAELAETVLLELDLRGYFRITKDFDLMGVRP